VLAEELDDVPRELRAFVDLGRPRRDPLARENANQVADLTLLLAQGLVGHAAIVGTKGLNQGSPAADKGTTVAFNLPLFLVPLPALVLGLLRAVGAL